MDYKSTLEKLNEVMEALDKVKDTFSPDDDEWLAERIIKIETLAMDARIHCKIFHK